LTSAELAERTREFITEAGLSLSRISAFTRARHGAGSAYFIAGSFLSSIRRGLTPHLCQIVALCEATGGNFARVMTHFGFDLAQLTGLQSRFHAERTVLLTPSEHLAHPPSGPGHLFAQIGRLDGMAFPEVVPGSIVRADTSHPVVSRGPKVGSEPVLCLVDHLQGLSCCYVSAESEKSVLLVPRHLPFPCLNYRLGDQARILGVVDAELRPWRNPHVPRAGGSRFERRAPIPALSRPQRLCELLRTSRERVGLHFRNAHGLSTRIARRLGKTDFAIALGTLSDYEASDKVPRHISKVLSLCVLYAIDFRRYLQSANIVVNSLTPVHPRAAPVPGVIPQDESVTNVTAAGGCCFSHGFPCSLFHACGGRLGGESGPLQILSACCAHRRPHLVIVNPCAGQLEEDRWREAWQRPMYLVKKRDGTQVFGFCDVHEGMMTVHNPPALPYAVERFPLGEGTVAGEVVAMLRHFAPLQS